MRVFVCVAYMLGAQQRKTFFTCIHNTHTHRGRAYLPVHSRLHCNYITKTSNFRSVRNHMLKHVENTRICIHAYGTNCVQILSQTLSKDMIKPAALQNIYTHSHTHTNCFFCWKPIRKWVRRFHVSYLNDLSIILCKCCSQNMQNEFGTMCLFKLVGIVAADAAGGDFFLIFLSFYAHLNRLTHDFVLNNNSSSSGRIYHFVVRRNIYSCIYFLVSSFVFHLFRIWTTKTAILRFGPLRCKVSGTWMKLLNDMFSPRPEIWTNCVMLSTFWLGFVYYLPILDIYFRYSEKRKAMEKKITTNYLKNTL